MAALAADLGVRQTELEPTTALIIDMAEKLLRLSALSTGALVLACFPAIMLTWSDGPFQVIQAALSFVAAILSALYLILFRSSEHARRHVVLGVLLGAAALLLLECVGVVVTSWRMD